MAAIFFSLLLILSGAQTLAALENRRNALNRERASKRRAAIAANGAARRTSFALSLHLARARSRELALVAAAAAVILPHRLLFAKGVSAPLERFDLAVKKTKTCDDGDGDDDSGCNDGGCQPRSHRSRRLLVVRALRRQQSSFFVSRCEARRDGSRMQQNFAVANLLAIAFVNGNQLVVCKLLSAASLNDGDRVFKRSLNFRGKKSDLDRS